MSRPNQIYQAVPNRNRTRRHQLHLQQSQQRHKYRRSIAIECGIAGSNYSPFVPGRRKEETIEETALRQTGRGWWNNKIKEC